MTLNERNLPKSYHTNQTKKHNSAHVLVEECIESAFFELLKTKKFEDITITEIIKKSGVSRMGFYRNFSSKEDIIENLVFKCFDQSITEITTARQLDFSITKIIETSLTKLQEHADKVKLLLDNNLIALLFTYYQKAFFALYETKSTSRIREYSAKMFLGELFTLEMAWIQNGLIETPQEMAKIYYKILKLRSAKQ